MLGLIPVIVVGWYVFLFIGAIILFGAIYLLMVVFAGNSIKERLILQPGKFVIHQSILLPLFVMPVAYTTMMVTNFGSSSNLELMTLIAFIVPLYMFLFHKLTHR